MGLLKLLSPEGSLLLGSENKRGVIGELLDSIDMRRHSIGRDAMLRKLLAREELMSTGIGLGLGIPHIRAAGVGEPVLRFGVAREGLSDYESIDGEPVRLLFLIILKEDQQREHVELLAEIVRLMKDSTIRESLVAVESGEQAYRLLQSHLEAVNS